MSGSPFQCDIACFWLGQQHNDAQEHCNENDGCTTAARTLGRQTGGDFDPWQALGLSRATPKGNGEIYAVILVSRASSDLRNSSPIANPGVHVIRHAPADTLIITDDVPGQVSNLLAVRADHLNGAGVVMIIGLSDQPEVFIFADTGDNALARCAVGVRVGSARDFRVKVAVGPRFLSARRFGLYSRALRLSGTARGEVRAAALASRRVIFVNRSAPWAFAGHLDS